MSLAKVYSLQAAAEATPTVENYRALVEEEVHFLASQSAAIEAAEERRARAAERKAALATELDAARQAKAEREAALPSSAPLPREPTPAPPSATLPGVEKEAAAAAAVGETGTAANAGLRHLNREECDAYRAEYLRLLREFTKRKEMLSYWLAYSAADLKYAELGVVSRWLDTWGKFFAESNAAVKGLRRQERGATNADTLPQTADLYKALDEVCRLQLQARSIVGRERYRRHAGSEEAVEDFMESQEQLLDWCRKQRATLGELTSLEDLMEFSSSFHTNVPIMDSNFLVLLEQSEPLAEDDRVQQALREVNEAWIDLTLLTYEKLDRAANNAHVNGPVEELCARWCQNMAPRVRQLLVNARNLLKTESDADGASSGRAGEMAATCDALLKEHEAHGIVCMHLADFNIRDECVRPHFDALKQELLSTLTPTVLSFPCYDDYEGRTEYKNRVEELREWIEVKSQKGTYIRLLERLEDTKHMIEEYADVLFPEDMAVLDAPANGSSGSKS